MHADTAPAPEALTTASAFVRMWRGFMTARIAIGMVLVAVMGVLMSMGSPPADQWLLTLCAIYTLASLAVRVFTQPQPPGQRFDPQWVFTIGVDLVAFAALQFLQAGGFNYSPLFALPVLMASVLGSTLLALGTAAGVALLMLTDAWVQSLHVPAETASRFLQAGLTGTGYFALALLVNQLAARLAREEEAARHGRLAARTQAQVNELVIATLAEGVLVLDAQGRVHAANPAARSLLGLADLRGAGTFVLGDEPAWAPLLELAQRTFEQHGVTATEVALDEDGASPRRVLARTRLAGAGDPQGQALCVMFLQDLREMEARLRTEKLAAMGRMSAAVAHEIRNPLAAIAQANELMAEDLREPELRQLSALVRNNTQRLAQIVEEILDLSRVRPGATEPVLVLDTSVAAACGDWTAQNRSGERLQLALAAPDVRVRFQADHLRRVLVNLLDNALRYAGVEADSIRVWTHAAAGHASLHVWSDGAPLEPTVQRHLFEPFFSSESRSSGLGLYICRELCERHGARIGYERRVAGGRPGNEFIVVFAPTPALAGPSALDTMTA